MPGIGKSLFTHNNGQSSNTYYDENFEPEWDILPEIPENVYESRSLNGCIIKC